MNALKGDAVLKHLTPKLLLLLLLFTVDGITILFNDGQNAYAKFGISLADDW